MHVIVVKALGSSTTASESRTRWLITRLLNVSLCRWTVGRHECRLDVLSRLVFVETRAFSRVLSSTGRSAVGVVVGRHRLVPCHGRP